MLLTTVRLPGQLEHMRFVSSDWWRGHLQQCSERGKGLAVVGGVAAAVGGGACPVLVAAEQTTLAKKTPWHNAPLKAVLMTMQSVDSEYCNCSWCASHDLQSETQQKRSPLTCGSSHLAPHTHF